MQSPMEHALRTARRVRGALANESANRGGRGRFKADWNFFQTLELAEPFFSKRWKFIGARFPNVGTVYGRRVFWGEA